MTYDPEVQVYAVTLVLMVGVVLVGVLAGVVAWATERMGWR